MPPTASGSHTQVPARGAQGANTGTSTGRCGRSARADWQPWAEPG